LKLERSEPFSSEAVGFVLAGGLSSRMGRDKALVSLNGEPLVAHAIARFREMGLDTFIAGARTESGTELGKFAQVVEDQDPGLGPLGGVCAALRSAPTRYVVFLSVDLPLMPSSLPAYLLRRARVTEVPVTLSAVNGFAQTFPAVLDRTTLPVLEAELEAERSSCYRAFEIAARTFGTAMDIVPAELLAQCGQVADPRGLPAAMWFLNVNTQAELGRAQRLALASIA
jgi:molybdenum cofactor guanylyltransferase